MIRRHVVLAAALATLAGPALAAPTFYTDEASFAAAAGGGLSVESFDGGPTGPAPGLFDFGAFSVQLGGVYNTTFGTAFEGVNPAFFGTGNVVAWFSDSSPTVFEFDVPIRAFGLQIFDLGTLGATTLSVSVDGVTYEPLTGYVGPSGNLVYLGFVDPDGVQSVSFAASTADDFIEFDDLSFGAVPEPGAWALMIGGFGLTGAALRRRAAVPA